MLSEIIPCLKCGRCKKLIPHGEDETCWFCNRALCYECWDEYGHCGHKEADEINERARQEIQPKRNG